MITVLFLENRRTFHERCICKSQVFQGIKTHVKMGYTEAVTPVVQRAIHHGARPSSNSSLCFELNTVQWTNCRLPTGMHRETQKTHRRTPRWNFMGLSEEKPNRCSKTLFFFMTPLSRRGLHFLRCKSVLSYCQLLYFKNSSGFFFSNPPSYFMTVVVIGFNKIKSPKTTH